MSLKFCDTRRLTYGVRYRDKGSSLGEWDFRQYEANQERFFSSSRDGNPPECYLNWHDNMLWISARIQDEYRLSTVSLCGSSLDTLTLRRGDKVWRQQEMKSCACKVSEKLAQESLSSMLKYWRHSRIKLTGNRCIDRLGKYSETDRLEENEVKAGASNKSTASENLVSIK